MMKALSALLLAIAIVYFVAVACGLESSPRIDADYSEGAQ